MIKKRYIYAPLLASIAFILFYIVLDLNILLCLILTVITYIGGLLLFKEKDVRKYDPNFIMHYCYLISKLANYTNNVNDEKVKNNILDITKQAEKIINMLEQKPNKVTQVYDGFDYYLPLCIQIVEQYIYLSKKDNLTKDENNFINDINKCLDGLENEFSKLLDNMNYTKMLDINSRIELFKKGNLFINDLSLKESSENDGR